MASVRSFHRYRGETSFPLPRLIAILREQLPEIAPIQTKYRVTEMPTERTIRFYTSIGLVDKPVVGSAGKAFYGYRHLLQTLAVKYLQSQYLPLVKVRSLVEGADNRELELMIPPISPVTAVHRRIAREDRKPPGAPLLRPAPQTAPAARETPEPPGGGIPAAPFADAGHGDLWHRVEVGPGIELHIHAATLSGEQRERLRGALLRELGVLRGWFGDGGET